MKKLSVFFFALLSLAVFAQEDSVFDLPPNQSMSIIGQGPGQDAAINPYEGSPSIAIVKNLGENPFEIRVRNQLDKTTITAIKPRETKKVAIPVGAILFLDSKREAQADVTFQKATEG